MIWAQLSIAVVGILGSAGAAFLGSWLALHRFRSERWWERKAAAYEAIFVALVDLYEEADRHLDEAEGGRELSEDDKIGLAAAANAAWPKVRKLLHLGSFVFSEKTEAVLRNLVKQIDEARNAESYHDHVEIRWVALRDALRALKAAAQADLKT